MFSYAIVLIAVGFATSANIDACHVGKVRSSQTLELELSRSLSDAENLGRTINMHKTHKVQLQITLFAWL